MFSTPIDSKFVVNDKTVLSVFTDLTLFGIIIAISTLTDPDEISNSIKQTGSTQFSSCFKFSLRLFKRIFVKLSTLPAICMSNLITVE